MIFTESSPVECRSPAAFCLKGGRESFARVLLLISLVPLCEGNASHGKMTYVHCKAGRGRSTTIVLCYLVQHKGMTPAAAYDYVRLIRPRVRLASSQWQAVQDYYEVKVKKSDRSHRAENQVMRTPALISAQDATVFDDSSVVVVTKSDLDGYKGRHESGIVGNDVWAELSLVYRVQFAGQAALARLSCVWLRCHTREKIGAEKLGKDSCSVEAEQRGGLGVDIPVY
ncbi:hypothetical protein ACLOJK_005657 [Asimina triloba]